jgi:uncharacterized Zn ribbon protein
MLKKILYIALLGGVIGGAYGYYLWNKKADKMADRTTQLTLSAGALASQYSDAVHLGRVIEVKGTVSAIENGKDATNISIETSDPMTAISCEMEKGSENTTAKTGDLVTIKGQCDGKISDVVLTRCIVLEK